MLTDTCYHGIIRVRRKEVSKMSELEILKLQKEQKELYELMGRLQGSLWVYEMNGSMKMFKENIESILEKWEEIKGK